MLSKVNKLFIEFRKYRYITKDTYAQEFSKRYNISICSLVRWKREGREETLKKCFRYCVVCDRFFYKRHSHQILCGNVNCLRTHNRLKYPNKGRKKPVSIPGVARKNAQRRLSRKKATRTHKPYTVEERRIAMSDLPIWDIAMKLGRSVSSVESHRAYIRRKRNEN